MSKFFTFRQNNSGGNFHHRAEDGIGIVVFVEAVDAAHAVGRAERIGLYFDGCATGDDCSCCGDRWDTYNLDRPADQPTQYEEVWRACEAGEEPELDWNIPSYIHFIGGEFKPARKARRPQ